MNQLRHVRWFVVGLLVGLVLIAVGAQFSSSQGFARQASPSQADAAAVPETVDAGLRIECRNDDQCIQGSESDWNDGRGRLRRRFLRVRVYNDGPETAQGCRVTLRSIAEILPDGLRSIDYKRPSLLIWARDRSARPEGKVIPFNTDPESVDLFYTVHHPAADEIYLKDAAYDSFLKFGKSYNFEVVATAIGTRAVSKHIKVRFGLTWDDFAVVSD